jgi:hypothetical protein
MVEMLSITRRSSNSVGATIARCKTVRDLENRSPDHRLNNDLSRMARHYAKAKIECQRNSQITSAEKKLMSRRKPPRRLM